MFAPGWKPGSDRSDPGSGPDAGPAADHPTGCDGHPRPWPAADAGSHAQRPGPALPLHPHASLLSGFNCCTSYCHPPKTFYSPDPSCTNQNPCTGPDDAVSLGSDAGGSSCPCTSLNADAEFGPNPSLSPRSCARNNRSPRFDADPAAPHHCPVTNIHPCPRADPHTGFILHTTFSSCTAPSAELCACPSTNPGPTADPESLHFSPCSNPSRSSSHSSNPSLHPSPCLVSNAHPDHCVAARPRTTGPDAHLQFCPRRDLGSCCRFVPRLG